jgi:hypothetical protein
MLRAVEVGKLVQADARQTWLAVSLEKDGKSWGK